MRRRIILTQVLVVVTAMFVMGVAARFGGTSGGLTRGALLLVVIVVALAAAVVAGRLAAAISAPLRGLALVAARLGSGELAPVHTRYGMPELDAVAEVLDVSAQRVGDQLTAERRLAADISHQLRTPLTALSMRLEEILETEDPDVVRAEARIAQQQVERLAGVVESLLTHARQGRPARDEVDIDTVVVQQLEEWRGTYVAAGRSVEISGETGLRAWVSSSVLSQAVATLLENALKHGGGRTSIRTRNLGTSVVIEVSDEGNGVRPELARQIFDREVSGAASSGLGLAVARSLIEVEGGRLELVRPKPATFALFLVKAPRTARTPDRDAGGAALAVGEAWTAEPAAPTAPTAQA